MINVEAEITTKSPFPSDRLTATKRSAKIPRLSVDDAVIVNNDNSSSDVCVFTYCMVIFFCPEGHELDQIHYVIELVN